MTKKELRTMSRSELEQRAEDIQCFIDADTQLGCGFAPSGRYSDLYEELYEIDEAIAALDGYASAEEMHWAEMKYVYSDEYRQENNLPF